MDGFTTTLASHKKTVLQTALLLISAIAAVVFAVTMNAHAQTQPKTGLAVSPPTFELTANPGDTLKNSIRVDNIVDTPLEVTVDARNFTALGEDGGVSLSTDDDQYSLANWIKTTPSKIIIPARESKTFDYTINVPKNATPGGRFGSIIFQTASTAFGGQTGVAVSQEVGTLVFVKIAGTVVEKASIAGFNTAGMFNDQGPVNFDVRVKNEGNVHFKPTGTITVSNFFGQTVATVPVNEQNVLPGAIRKMDASWDSGWLFGRYNATLSLVYGKDQQVITASTAFWGFPYKLIGIVIVALGLIGAFLYPRRARIMRAFKILFGKE
jgi:hypothetical protein